MLSGRLLLWERNFRASGGYVYKFRFCTQQCCSDPDTDLFRFFDFAHFLLLLYVAKHKKADGQVAACYLIFYSIGRFVIEFFRGDIERGSVGVLSTSQFISIFTTVAGIILLLTVVKKQKQEANISLNSKG